MGLPSGKKLHGLKVHQEHRQKPEHMKFLPMWAIPAHALLLSCPCRGKRHMVNFAMLLHKKSRPQKDDKKTLDKGG